MWPVVLLSVGYSIGAHLLCYKLVFSTRDMFIRAGMFGKDLNKNSEEKV